jgi:amino acid adenylation domain-containing protein
MNKNLSDKIFNLNDDTDDKSRYSERTFNDLFTIQSQNDGSKIALHSGDLKLSYQQLYESSNKLAWFLLKYNIQIEERIGLALDRSADMIIALLGIMKSGAAYVPLDPEYPRERIEFMLEDSSAKILLTSKKYKGHYSTQAKEIYIEDFWDTIQDYSADDPKINIDGSNLAYVLYTSGSTGKPKGVQIEHRSLTNLLASMQTFPGISRDDVFLAVTTISFDIAALELFLPLITGALLIVTDAKVTKDGRALLNIINSEAVSIMQATPSTYRMMLECDWIRTHNLKVLCCGEPMTNDLASKLLSKCGWVYNMYGPTETTIYSTGTQIISADEAITIGHPIANTQIYILDENQEPVPHGETGEICIAGNGLSRGYLNQPGLTDQKFIEHQLSKTKGEKIYRTGDLGRFLENNEIQCFGRIDHQIKINGYRIELGEIEHHITKQDNVKEAIVVSREDKPGNKRLTAYIVPDVTIEEANFTTQIQGWKNILKDSLPKFMVPNDFVILEAFPLTYNGKIDRNLLPKPNTKSIKSISSIGIKKRIAEIWSECIGVEDIGLADDFFEIGGNSIIAVRIIIQLEKEYEVPLPLAALFEYNTIEKIAVLIQNKIVLSQSKCLITIKPTGNKVPLYIIHGGGLAVFCFRDLAKDLHPEQPVYGLQAIGIDGLEKPLNKVEDIAARYIVEILEQNPHGPYAFAGYSLGGVIAFEIVKQFKAMGKKVTMLAMLDSYAYSSELVKNPLSAKKTLDLKAKRFMFRLKHLVSILKENPKTFLIKLNNIKRHLLKYPPENLYNLNDILSLEIYMIYEAAVFNYQITEFDGVLELFCSTDSIFYTKQDPIYLGWKTYAKTINRYVIEGNHYSMFFPPNHKNFAQLLQKALDDHISN